MISFEMSQVPAGPRLSAGPAPTAGPLVDTFGRRHDNLRVSVTDRCNLRCTYCMPEDVTFLPKDELLTFEEIAQFVEVAVGLGVTKVRLTGGEPLLRRHRTRRASGLVQSFSEIATAMITRGWRRTNLVIHSICPDQVFDSHH